MFLLIRPNARWSSSLYFYRHPFPDYICKGISLYARSHCNLHSRTLPAFAYNLLFLLFRFAGVLTLCHHDKYSNVHLQKPEVPCCNTFQSVLCKHAFFVVHALAAWYNFRCDVLLGTTGSFHCNNRCLPWFLLRSRQTLWYVFLRSESMYYNLFCRYLHNYE